jgi:hypothetical protein
MIGGVPHLPRFHAAQQRAEAARKLATILLETGEAATPKRTAGATSGGDERALRGLPAIGRGVFGAMSGTSPYHAAVFNETSRSRNGISRRR